MVGINGSLVPLVVEDPVGVNGIRPVSHVLEMDLNRVSNLAFYYWTQKA